MRKGVQKLYKDVASTYEVCNHCATFGLDRYWRKKAIEHIRPAKGMRWLDVCCGTGELSQLLAAQAKRDIQIFSVDFSHSMISYAKKKQYDQKVFFVLADVGALPFAEETFDLVTISFSTRNLNLKESEMQSHLIEFYRVLKPQGQFLNLETSQPSFRFLRKAFHFYVRKIVAPLGAVISGSRSGYKYLAYTIPRFYSRDEFTGLLQQTGFTQVQSQPLFFGIAAIHSAFK
jgi:demethylmenaquinone methyltransferase/2-methoxy-6-polyprenyl-1,4-benzoquinol methylase